MKDEKEEEEAHRGGGKKKEKKECQNDVVSNNRAIRGNQFFELPSNSGCNTMHSVVVPLFEPSRRCSIGMLEIVSTAEIIFGTCRSFLYRGH
ncbi:unnamed protein product [Camellia sinensis]